MRYLDGQANNHWLVTNGKHDFVLRAYSHEQADNIAYEHEVMGRLKGLGWPVPQLIEAPLRFDGRFWCLFSLLPGNSQLENGLEDRKRRGRLLAQLHEATATFGDLGQRDGFHLAEDAAREPGLIDSIREYEILKPQSGHILRWHLDKLVELFGKLELRATSTLVLHSDFAPWNLLYENGELSGVIDFESTHRNHRVSDFALSWRGYQHEVIDGYEEIYRLSELDRALIVPCYWSWIFLGLKQEIDAMLGGRIEFHDFDWQVKQLLRRSHFHQAEPYNFQN